MVGSIHLVRYADDFIICTNKSDAPRIVKALEKRLDRFSLKMNLEKTKVIPFRLADQAKGIKQGTFKFLGFTYYLGKSRKGKEIVKIKTDKKTFVTKLKEFSLWCRVNRNKYRLAYLWKVFCSKLRGHIQYYGVSFNIEAVRSFIYHASRMFFKWMNRRSQRRSFNWSKFTLYEKLNPILKARITHKLF